MSPSKPQKLAAALVAMMTLHWKQMCKEKLEKKKKKKKGEKKGI